MLHENSSCLVTYKVFVVAFLAKRRTMQTMLLYQALVLPFASKAYACNPDGGGGGGLPSKYDRAARWKF